MEAFSVLLFYMVLTMIPFALAGVLEWAISHIRLFAVLAEMVEDALMPQYANRYTDPMPKENNRR